MWSFWPTKPKPLFVDQFKFNCERKGGVRDKSTYPDGPLQVKGLVKKKKRKLVSMPAQWG